MIDATNKNRQDVHRRRRIRRAASRSRGVEGEQGWQRRIVDTKKPTIIGSVWRKRDFQEVTAKERDFIGASARLAPFSSLLNQRLCDEVFQREAASQDLIDAYLNHISRKSRLPLFPDVSFSCPLLPASVQPLGSRPFVPIPDHSSFATLLFRSSSVLFLLALFLFVPAP